MSNTIFQRGEKILRGALTSETSCAFRWGTRGTCPSTVFRRWGYNIPWPTHFCSLCFIFEEVSK